MDDVHRSFKRSLGVGETPLRWGRLLRRDEAAHRTVPERSRSVALPSCNPKGDRLRRSLEDSAWIPALAPVIPTFCPTTGWTGEYGSSQADASLLAGRK